MNIAYFSTVDYTNSMNLGIIKKIRGQKYNCTIYLLPYNKHLKNQILML